MTIDNKVEASVADTTDALRALDPSYWEVEVRVSGESVLTIGSDHLAGIRNIADYADTVRKCGEHLLSFIGDHTDSAAPDGMCYCQEGVTCPTCEVIDDGGPYNGIDWQATCDALQAEVAQLQAALAEARRDAERLRSFVQEVMPLDEEWIGDVDGGTLQDAAVKHGLLAEHEVTEPCGDNCNCASYGDFPQTCYRPTQLLRPDAALHQRKENGHA